MSTITLKTTNRTDDSVAPDLPVTAKTANYTVVAGDIGKEFEFTSASAVSCSLPAAATAGNGFNTILRNTGAGDLTVNPDGAETIDGEASLTLATDECYWIRSNGSSWGTLKPKGKPAFGPASTTENKIPQWDAKDTLLKDGLTVGTAANNLVQLDGSGNLPALDGSNLTGIGGGGAETFLASDTLSAESSSELFWSADDYDEVRVYFKDLTLSSDQQIRFQLSTDGSSWHGTSGDYHDANGGGVASYFRTNVSIGGDTSESSSGCMSIWYPEGGAARRHISCYGRMAAHGTNGLPMHPIIMADFRANTTDIVGIKVYLDSGTMSGGILVTGIKHPTS